MPALHIMLNADLEWSRGKRAAHAIHAALRAHQVIYDTPVVVLNANVAEASSLAHVVVDGDRVLSGANDPVTTDEPLVVRVVVRKSDTRDDTAVAAVRAAMRAYRLPDIDIISIKEVAADTLKTVPGVIRDAGRTELEPGTVTSAACMDRED